MAKIPPVKYIYVFVDSKEPGLVNLIPQFHMLLFVALCHSNISNSDLY